jgi:hypothetical protein
MKTMIKTMMAVAALALAMGNTQAQPVARAELVRRIHLAVSMQDSVVQSGLLRRLRAIKGVEIVPAAEDADYYLGAMEISISVQQVVKGHAVSLATVVANRPGNLYSRLYILGVYSLDSQLDEVVADFDVEILEPDRMAHSRR